MYIDSLLGTGGSKSSRLHEVGKSERLEVVLTEDEIAYYMSVRAEQSL
jgi:hypothetical protein